MMYRSLNCKRTPTGCATDGLMLFPFLKGQPYIYIYRSMFSIRNILFLFLLVCMFVCHCFCFCVVWLVPRNIHIDSVVCLVPWNIHIDSVVWLIPRNIHIDSVV